MALFRRGPHRLTGTSNAGALGRNRKSESIYLAQSRAVNAAIGRCYQHGAVEPWQVVTLIAGSKQQSLLMAGDDDEMFMTRSLNVTPNTTEHHLIIYVTNNKRLCSTFCTTEANY